MINRDSEVISYQWHPRYYFRNFILIRSTELIISVIISVIEERLKLLQLKIFFFIDVIYLNI